MTTTYRQQGDGIPVIDKAAAANLDYLVDWTSWLSTGEAITSITTASDNAGITFSLSPTYTGTAVTIWLIGGTLGTTYLITTHITTSAGRQDDRSFRVTVKTR
jgi:hypothetical protein